MTTTEVKSKLIDQFYYLFDPDDWLEGIELYQDGYVNKINKIHDLIQCELKKDSNTLAQVRIKVLPNKKTIQWIECSCRKNRQKGQFCEHIAAMTIYLDREEQDLFSTLELKAPLIASIKAKRQRQQTEKPDIQKDDATQTILSHLKGSINKANLIKEGPNIRVNMEIKRGQPTKYDLDTDSAAKFLLSSAKTKHVLSDNLKELKVHGTPAKLGFRLFMQDEEKLLLERVVKFPIKKSAKIPASRWSFQQGMYQLAGHEAEPEFASFLPLRLAAKYIGREFVFFPKIGYWPIASDFVKQEWNDQPVQKVFKGDAIAELLQAQCQPYKSMAPLWIEAGLSQIEIQSTPDLEEIKLLKEEEGWFYLDPKYGKGDTTVSMIELVRQHQKKKRKYLKAGKTWLKVPEFITEYQWQLDENDEYLRVDALGLLRLKAAVGEFDKFTGRKQALNKLRSRIDFEQDTTPPPEVSHSLRSYQHDGLKWLWWLYRNRLHGLLADEMGLGKTHQAMSLFQIVHRQQAGGRFLVVCPTTVLDHWQDKLEQYCQDLKAYKFHGPKRSKTLSEFSKDGQIMITSYGIMLREARNLSQFQWEIIVLDEAHYVKNNTTATYRAACRLNSRLRICLSGTPMENHLTELKNIFDFLLPGYLGSDKYFRKQYLSDIEAGSHPEKELALQRLIHPFKLRRTKDQVLHDLPSKVEDIRHCTLSNEQIRLYRSVIDRQVSPLVASLQDKDAPIPYLHVFSVLTLLKQICDHPALIMDNVDYTQHESGKFDLLKELFEESFGSGHKVVIFSQYVKMVEIISSYLKTINIDAVTLTGKSQNRGALIKKFQNDDNCRAFCGSLMAGGIGIDLTAASVVIHFDRWWNASKENQATDRVHRIGQNKNVLVLKLITRGTLEEKIDKMIQKKQDLVSKFLDKDEDIFKNLTRQELIDLLT